MRRKGKAGSLRKSTLKEVPSLPEGLQDLLVTSATSVAVPPAPCLLHINQSISIGVYINNKKPSTTTGTVMSPNNLIRGDNFKRIFPYYTLKKTQFLYAVLSPLNTSVDLLPRVDASRYVLQVPTPGEEVWGTCMGNSAGIIPIIGEEVWGPT